MPVKRPALVSISTRLRVWARWARTANMARLDYPQSTIEARLRDEGGVLISGRGCYAEHPNPEAEEIERGVQVMPLEIRRVCIQHYLRRDATDSERAHEARMSVREFYHSIRSVKYWLHGYLCSAKSRK